MFSFMLSVLISTQLLSAVPLFVEEIRIAESLVIRAEYMPQGSLLTDEAMVLSIEDFGILQAEVENSTGACDLRIDSLKDQHAEHIEDMQRRCDERNQTYRSELEKSIELNDQLQESLKQERKAHMLQKWVNLGVVVGGSILTAVVLTR